MVSYRPPLASWLLDQHGDLCRTVAQRAVAEGVEQAVTLTTPHPQEPMSASEIASGSERGVTSPSPPNGAHDVVRLHTHPPQAQVTFSTRDIAAFAQSTLAEVPMGRLPPGPNGYAVIGWRGDDMTAGEAHLQTLEPTPAWAEHGLLGRDRLRRRVRSRAAAARTANETNPLLDLLDPYVTHERVEFHVEPPRPE